MSKILKKYTLIPPELYVKRHADRQLKSIIDEMERPGYVLVAHEMGKTNLLLNAKREFENAERLFAYVDLSNPFDEERDCYQNIIDLIIEPKEDLSNKVSSEICSLRNRKLPPHKEYLKSLRIILKKIKGTLIILLDEIDALKNFYYSDHIFAQIRSNYFFRTNFPELKKVTYVLSGVIEPSDLIKDRNKSPFNIGEKIYLNDFSYDEHLEFIEKSRLQLAENLIKGIFYWTKGNPLLTYDICSEIEDSYRGNNIINNQLLEKLIVEKYLSTYDIPPISYIRELVSKDNEIRSAVLKLQYGDANISDEVKRKLYLSGIINLNIVDDEIKIKNPIISKSISIEWLKSVSFKSYNNFELGVEYITKEIQLSEGISLLKKYLKDDININYSNKRYAHYYIGYAYHKLKKYAESNKYLEKYIIHRDISSDLHFRQKCFIGLNYLKLNEIDEGKLFLEDIVENYKKGEPYLIALLNLAITLISFDRQGNEKRAISLLTDLVNCSDIVDLDSLSYNSFKSIALYYLAQIYIIRKHSNKALEKLTLAIEIATPKQLPKLFYKKLKLKKDGKYKKRIIRSIIDNFLSFDDKKTDPLCYTEEDNYTYLLTIYEENHRALFDELLEYTIVYLYKDTVSRSEYLFRLTEKTNDSKIIYSILKSLIQIEEEIQDEVLLLKIYRQLSITSYKIDLEFISYFQEYKMLFSKSKGKLIANDFASFMYAIKYFSKKNELDLALNLCMEIEAKFDEEKGGGFQYEILIIYHAVTMFYFDKNDGTKTIEYADKALDLESVLKRKRTFRSEKKSVANMIKDVCAIKYSLVKREPYRKKYNFKRNERITVKYKDGSIKKQIKFKKVEIDVLLNKCSIVP